MGLFGVLGATCTCNVLIFAFYRIYPFTSTDTLLRAIGKRAHPIHSMVFFSLNCVLASTVMYASHLDPSPEGTF